MAGGWKYFRNDQYFLLYLLFPRKFYHYSCLSTEFGDPDPEALYDLWSSSFCSQILREKKYMDSQYISSYYSLKAKEKKSIKATHIEE